MYSNWKKKIVHVFCTDVSIHLQPEWITSPIFMVSSYLEDKIYEYSELFESTHFSRFLFFYISIPIFFIISIKYLFFLFTLMLWLWSNEIEFEFSSRINNCFNVYKKYFLKNKKVYYFNIFLSKNILKNNFCFCICFLVIFNFFINIPNVNCYVFSILKA
jgi:hypothetical protein